MTLYSCRVHVFNGRYSSSPLTVKVKASDWRAAAGKAIAQVMQERKKLGLSGRHLESVNLEIVRVRGKS